MEDRDTPRAPTAFELGLSDISYIGLPRGYLARFRDDEPYDTSDLDDLPEIAVY